ncbi:MAG: ADP-ribosylation factor-like protein [Candidatus Hodarchaeota archaeon]
MLRQIYILKDGNVLYEKNFGKALTHESFQNISQEILKEASRGLGKDFGSTYFFKHKIVYSYEKECGLLFILIVGLNDEMNQVKSEITKLKNEFINIFGDNLDNLDTSLIELLNPLIFSIYKNIKTKISLVGFSGVGKTTITKLIRSEEIPDVHIPTITGKVSAIKIGKLYFHLWDFAGQEQFSYLWNDFIYGSDAVLVITDSSLENVEKSKFFIELLKENAPDAHAAIIGNKQDLPDALSVEKIEEILKLKTYSMIAIDPDNRNKMIQIIADILEINTEISPLLKPLFERDSLISQAETYLKEGNMVKIHESFEKISELCYELGDFILYKEFREKADKIKGHLGYIL